jgi:hypothetical protein
VIEKLVKRDQIERYFKRINYFYRQLADAEKLTLGEVGLHLVVISSYDFVFFR